MVSAHQNASQLKFGWRWVFLALLVLLPIETHAEEKDFLPNHHALLPQIRKAVGKDWNVIEILQGYLMTYKQPVIYYNPISPSSKIDHYQRVLHGWKEPWCIKIIYGSAQPNKATFEINAQREQHYFTCEPVLDRSLESIRYDREQTHPPLLFTNLDPNESIFPAEIPDTYNKTLDAMSGVFHYRFLIIVD